MSTSPLVAEQVLARLEDAVVAVLDGGGGLRRLRLEVGEVGLTERALDHVEVEPEIAGKLGVERVEQEAAELLTARAGQAAPTPDRAQGVKVGVAAVLADVFEPGAKLRGVAKRFLDPRQITRRQRIGQVGTKGLVV